MARTAMSMRFLGRGCCRRSGLGQKQKSSRRAHVVRFASESGLNRLSNRADRKVAMILLLAKACTNYFEGDASKWPQSVG